MLLLSLHCMLEHAASASGAGTQNRLKPRAVASVQRSEI
jgi:hypothetical protein